MEVSLNTIKRYYETLNFIVVYENNEFSLNSLKLPMKVTKIFIFYTI